MERNYRFGRLEIDIIGQIKNTIVFIEVKTRQSKRFGYPEEAVDNKKTDHILSCADHFIYQNQWNGDIRFDIISIILKPEISIEHIEDAAQPSFLTPHIDVVGKPDKLGGLFGDQLPVGHACP